MKTSSKFQSKILRFCSSGFTSWLSIITTLDVNRFLKEYTIDSPSIVDRGTDESVAIFRDYARLKLRLIYFYQNKFGRVEELHSSNTIGPRPSKFQHSSLSIFNEITILPISMAKRKISRFIGGGRSEILIMSSYLRPGPWNYRTLSVSARHVRDVEATIRCDSDRPRSRRFAASALRDGARARASRLSHLLFYARITSTR